MHHELANRHASVTRCAAALPVQVRRGQQRSGWVLRNVAHVASARGLQVQWLSSVHQKRHGHATNSFEPEPSAAE